MPTHLVLVLILIESVRVLKTNVEDIVTRGVKVPKVSVDLVAVGRQNRKILAVLKGTNHVHGIHEGLVVDHSLARDAPQVVVSGPMFRERRTRVAGVNH
ncbi:hypothetical protein BZA05DRAFT_387411 [Tricharina praecox]|uniref:uncharacterized protein n=1 Tax=Tricharina praecox TaxID=43433 RepID=UPI00221E95D1|nr:uncharacterized protein BZA05DRAFT_387411 [Tricharina praecox]KAI5857154.1 hypothetical protein BZA05DRAFT_387411 [Tricharina praecox]